MSAAGLSVIMQLQPSAIAELNSVVGEVPFDASLPMEPVQTDDQSVDVRRYVDIEHFCPTADGQILFGPAYDDDNLFICGLNFLKFAGMNRPSILFGRVGAGYAL